MGRSGDHHDDLRFPNRSGGSVMNCPTSGMSSSPFFASAWDPIASLGSHENFGASSVVVSRPEFNNSPYPVVIDHQGIGVDSQITSHYPSDSSLVQMVPKFQCYESGSFSEMVGSYGMNQCGQIGSSGCPPNYALSKKDNVERSSANDAQCQDDHRQLIDDGALRASPNVKGQKRVADSNSSFDPSKDTQGELPNDHSNESSDALKEQDEKKQKTEAGTNVRGKSASKPGKDSSSNGEAPKEYIHVRARRGQATNSHSLAERVRREKISERMRLLQELVPGCNKITGKAVMLDEIINYVQSLQQQVEFLSMKLATVNPELNIDIERLLSSDILHSRGSNASLMGFNPGLNMNAYSNGLFQPGVPVIPNATTQFPPMPHAVLENEMQTLFQMGHDSNPAMDSFGPNGRLKLELQNLEKMKGFNS